jgi:hypothetical protein
VKGRLVHTSIVMLASSLVLTGLATTASATTPTDPGQSVLPNAAENRMGPTKYKAGYTATALDRELRGASAAFTLPALQCREKFDRVGVGIGSEPTAAPPRYLAVVWFACEDGVPSYTMHTYLYGRRSGVAPASVGDRIRVTITRQASGKVMARAKNTTKDLAVHTRGRPADGGPAEHDVDFGAFPTFYGKSPVPNFGAVRMRNPQISGPSSQTCITQADPVKNTRSGRGGLQIDASDLTDCSFSVLFVHH